MARWYPAAAIASLLFMLLGCVVYAMHLPDTDPNTLPLDQRVMFEAEPRWVTVALGHPHPSSGLDRRADAAVATQSRGDADARFA